MELPSVRELELETLLREKDVQLAEMTDEIVWLRQYVAKQPGPSTTEPLTLPPAFVSVLLPHINNAANNSSNSSSSTNNAGTSTSGSSSTVTAALTQRVKLLQTENDELYDLLKHGETGKLKDEVRGLRRVVSKLEGALKESHQVMKTLSVELDKANETIKNTSRSLEPTTNHKSSSHFNSYSPKDSYNTSPRLDSASHAEASNTSRPIPPTEPRAHKRPRLSETPAQEQQPSLPPPPPRLAPSLPQKPQTNHSHHHNSHHNTNNSSHRHNAPSRLADGRHHSNTHDNRSNNHLNNNTKGIVKMEVDDAVQQMPSPAQRDSANNRDRNTNTNSNRDHRERGSTGRERERDSGGGGGGKERDRARDTGASGGSKDWNDRNAVGNRNLNNGHLPSNPRRTSHTNGHIAGTSIRGAANNPLLNTNNPGRRGTANNSGSGHHYNTNTSDQGSRTLQERLGL